jgi:hypothetical protein
MHLAADVECRVQSEPFEIFERLKCGPKTWRVSQISEKTITEKERNNLAASNLQSNGAVSPQFGTVTRPLTISNARLG